MYFPSTPTNLNQVTKSPIAHVLFTLIVQLLKADRERLETVAPKFPLHDLSSPPISSSLHPLKHLWKFLFASIVAVPNRKSIIIIDALDEVPNNSTPEMRQNFLRNLLQLRADVSNTGVDLKIFLTSRPYDDIKKELSSIPSIERDKERQGE
jgi:hypothetical protein